MLLLLLVVSVVVTVASPNKSRRSWYEIRANVVVVVNGIVGVYSCWPGATDNVAWVLPGVIPCPKRRGWINYRNSKKGPE